MAATASAASLLITKPSTVFATEANSKVKVGCVGLGGRGSWIARHVASHSGYEVAAVADYFPDVAMKVGAELNVPQNHRYSGLDGYKRLLDSGVEAVFLETPPCFFPEHVEAASEAGCHIYMAKPVAIDVPGTLKIQQLGGQAQGRKKVFLVDFQTRTDEFFIEGIKKVHEGWLGKVGLIDAVYSDDGFPDPPLGETIAGRLANLIWVNDNAIGGGKLLNAGVHAIDVALWMAQENPTDALGASSLARADAHGDSHDIYSVTYNFRNGIILNYQGEFLPNQHHQISCHAYGSEGYIEAYYAGKVGIRGNKRGWRGGENTDLYASGMKANVETFYKSIVNGVYENPTVEPSVNANLACILGQMAAQKKTQITWDEILKTGPEIKPNLTGLKI
jgi:predicted dehydrogenase